MYSEDEIDPHRGQPQATASANRSLYDSIDPFAEGRPAGEAWGAQEPSAHTGSDAGTHADSDTGTHADSDTGTHADSNAGAHTGSNSGAQPPAGEAAAAPLLRFTVGQMVDRSKRTPGFTFDVMTTLPSFKARRYAGVERNQIEFERLQAHLRATYPECLVPTLGPGTTASKYVGDYQNDRIVVQLLQQWLARVAAHPLLRQDYELRQFVEAPFAFNPALTSAPALSVAPAPSAGFFSWGKARARVARSANPTAFERQLEATAENLDAFQRNLGDVRRWHGRLARARARLALDVRDAGTKLVSAGMVEHNAGLARALKRTGKSLLHVGACAQGQASLEGSRAVAVADVYTLACDNVQRTLGSRQAIFTEHQVAARQLERRRQAVAELRVSASIGAAQAQEALAELAAAQADADSKRARAERVDRVLAADLHAFEANREGDLRALFGALGRDQLQAERQVLGELRAALDTVRHAGSAGSSSTALSG
ncbi:Vacuolar protein sorting-associated protein 17 [Coemansia sp. RSA 2705]|nr:Vacuolar protein sorting-associated protein 17 [Coemansia sp. RSA 2705]